MERGRARALMPNACIQLCSNVVTCKKVLSWRSMWAIFALPA